MFLPQNFPIELIRQNSQSWSKFFHKISLSKSLNKTTEFQGQVSKFTIDNKLFE